MFEGWSERRRRWFLIAFCASSWVGFAHGLSALGGDYSVGGIGPRAFVLATIVVAIGSPTIVWSAFHLRVRDWAVATFCGLVLSLVLAHAGIRDAAAAGGWAIQCRTGDGGACANLAGYFARGRSPVHGWLDAVPLHERACRLGGPGTTDSCQIARVFDRPRTPPSYDALTRACLESGVGSACRDAATVLERSGRFEQMYEYLAEGCDRRDRASCLALLDSGNPALRQSACEVLDPICRTSDDRACWTAELRCERVRSPRAGVD